MGAQQSKTDVLKEVLNEVSIDVMNRNSNAASGYINQTNELIIRGNTDTTIKGFSQVNSAVINISSITSAAATGDLQSDLTASITESISQEAPAIGYSANETSVSSIVSNAVNSNITVENLQEINATVEQSNVIKILAEQGLDATSVSQKNEANLILEMVNEMNANIIASLQTEGAIVGDLTQTTQSLFEFGGAFFIVIIMAIGAFFYFGKNIMAPLKMMMNPYSAAIVVILIAAGVGYYYTAE